MRTGPVGATDAAQTHSPGCRASAMRASSAGELTLAPWAYNGTLLARAPPRSAIIHARNHLLTSLRNSLFISVRATSISRIVTRKCPGYQRLSELETFRNSPQVSKCPGFCAGDFVRGGAA